MRFRIYGAEIRFMSLGEKQGKEHLRKRCLAVAGRVDGRDESWEARRPAGRWWKGQTDQAVGC